MIIGCAKLLLLVTFCFRIKRVDGLGLLGWLLSVGVILKALKGVQS